MFGKWFGKKKTDAATKPESARPAASASPARPAPRQEMSQQMASLLRAIKEESKTKPLVGPEIGAKEILQRILSAMKDERGVHVDSVLCALGALAGYACQASVRAQAMIAGVDENALFVVVDTQDGGQYYFGDALNKPLAESQYSVWGIAAAGAQMAGASTLIDLNDVFKHVSETVGSEAFGKPRYPQGHNAGDTPAGFLKALWPALFPTVKLFCQTPDHWPILYAIAAQQAIVMGKEAIAPELALQIVMESAVPMSKVKLAAL
jgi:hypothetical protein